MSRPITHRRTGDGTERGVPYLHKLALAHAYREMSVRGEEVDIADSGLRDRLLKKIGLRGKNMTLAKRRANYERERGRSLQQRLRGVGLEPLKYKSRASHTGNPKKAHLA